MLEYLRLLPTILMLLAVFGLLFCIVAGVAKRLAGARSVWIVWGIYVPLVTGSCVYGLSGLAVPGSDTGARVVYYCAVALGGIGFPLWCAGRALLDLARQRSPLKEHWQVLAAWAVSIATAPLGLLLVFIVDSIAAALDWSPWA